jgi:uncharacterized coiled-coil protein SlyX
MTEEQPIADSPEGESGAEARVKELETQLAESNRQRQGLDKAMTENQKQLKEALASRDSTRADIQALKDQQQILIALAAEGRAAENTDDLEPGDKASLLQKFQNLTKQQEAKRVGNQYRLKVENLGLTEDDPEYWDIYKDVSSGLFKAADVKLKRIEKSREQEKTVATKEEPKESDEERINRLAEEKFNQMVKEKGLDHSDAGGATGGGSKLTADKVRKMSKGELFDNAKEVADLPLGLG